MRKEIRIAIVAIQDNKLFMVRMKDGDVWYLPTVKQGNWLSEERAVSGRIQKEIGCPVRINARLGDFESIDGSKSLNMSVYMVDLLGPIFVRNSDIVEWRYINSSEARKIVVQEILKDQVIPRLIRQRLLIWPTDRS